MIELATFAGGCFWCTEALFQNIKGVEKVISGYSGGDLDNPSYQDVSSGTTGHAEAIQIAFDPKLISYKDLLYIFFKTHDPTTKDKQGRDVGHQYRSVVFYHNENQKNITLKIIKDLQKDYTSPIVTEVVPFKNFFEAEDYHQDYYNKNKSAGYCKLVIDPKIQKLRADFAGFLKK